MSECFHVEKPFLDQLATLGWTVIDQGHGLIPSDPMNSVHGRFRVWLLSKIFRASISALYLYSARSLNARVARAQKIISLHLLLCSGNTGPAWVSSHSHIVRVLRARRAPGHSLPPPPSCYDAHPMSTRSESGQTNLVAIGVLVGVVITGVWVWKRLSFETQDYVIDQAIPVAFAGLAIAAGLFILVRAVNRRRGKLRERAKLLAAFERATAQEKRLEIAFALMDVSEYRADGLEAVTPSLRDLFATTLQRALGDEQHRVRGMAASYLGALNDRTVIPLLLKALDDDHAYVRSSAALGLGRLRAGEAKEKLMTVMTEDWDQTVRSRSKEALERINQA